MKCVTLISSFGLRDGSATMAKAILMKHVGYQQPIMDISHLVEPRRTQQSAFILLANYPHFPKGSCHIIFSEVYYDRRPQLLLAAVDGHFVLAPNNGFLPFAFQGKEMKVWDCFQLEEHMHFADWLDACGLLAHQVLQNGAPTVATNETIMRPMNAHWLPIIQEDKVECHVLHIDRYENIVLNITRDTFLEAAKGRKFSVSLVGHKPIDKISKHYTDVRISEPLCRFNQANFLELCIHGGKASSILGFTERSEQHLLYNKITIAFSP